MIMIALVGEQAIPNLLPILHYQPAVAVLVYSEFTQRAHNRLLKLLPAGCTGAPMFVPNAYDIDAIRKAIFDTAFRQGWTASELLFNITGGTKSMALAAYLEAAELRTPFIYLQSEGKQSRLYRYAFDASGAPCTPESEFLANLLSLDLYLRAYVDAYQLTGFANDQDGGRFEKAIYGALVDYVDEIMIGVKLLGALDIDFAIRCGNQVGVIEAKTGKGLKKGIDQLNSAAGQRYLGAYVGKLLVKDTVWDDTQSNLRELAEARNVKAIELASYSATGHLSAEDISALRTAVAACLGQPARASAELPQRIPPQA